MTLKIQTLIFLVAAFATSLVAAQQDDLPNGKPFQTLSNNDIAMMEIIDGLVEQVEDMDAEITMLYAVIAKLSKRVAALEGVDEGPSKEEQLMCLKLGGTWVDGVCKIPEGPSKEEVAKCKKLGGVWVDGVCKLPKQPLPKK